MDDVGDTIMNADADADCDCSEMSSDCDVSVDEDDEEDTAMILKRNEDDQVYKLDQKGIVQGKRFVKMVILGRPRPMKRYKLGRGKRKIGK